MSNRVRMHAKPCLKRVPIVSKPCQTVFFSLDSVSNCATPQQYLQKPCRTTSKIRVEKSCPAVSYSCCFKILPCQTMSFLDFLHVVWHRALHSCFSFVSDHAVYKKTCLFVYTRFANILVLTDRARKGLRNT